MHTQNRDTALRNQRPWLFSFKLKHSYSTGLHFTLALDVCLPSNVMDKTKSKLAAFFDNDGEESSFPVRRTELFPPHIVIAYLRLQT
jgi:hypothetical protein